MRTLGFFLLVAAFLWSAALQVIVVLRGGIRPILAEAYQGIAAVPSGPHAQAQLEAIVNHAVGRAFDAQPVFLFPGSLMLLGGVLVAIGSRKRKPHEVAE